MKKIIYLFTLLLISCFSSYAQFSQIGIKDIQRIKNTKTYVVLHDSVSDFNIYVKKAIEENWKLTPYEFINFKDLDNYKKSDKNSFIFVSTFTNQPHTGNEFYRNKAYAKRGVKSVMTSGPTMVNGQIKNQSGFEYKPTYGTVVLSLQIGKPKGFGFLTNWASWAYTGKDNVNVNSPKLIPLVKIINNTANLIFNEKLKDLKTTSGDAEDYYNPEKSLKGKTLLLLDREIPIINSKTNERLSVSEMKKKFSGDIKIVNDEELLNLIDSKDPKYLLFGSMVEGTFSLVYLFDINGKIHSFDRMNRMSFNQPETDGWFLNALEKFDKKFK